MSLTPERGRRLAGWVSLTLWLLAAAACSVLSQPQGSGVAGVLYADRFETGESGPWLLEGDELSQATIRNGSLVVEIGAANTVHFVTLDEPTFSNFAVDVEVTQLAGSQSSSYGLLFRMVSPDQFYRYEITGNGEYLVERRDSEGRVTQLTDGWIATPVLNTGLNETNHLSAVVAGGAFSFYANHELLVQLSDGAYDSGKIALDAGTFDQPGLQVSFDNLVVSWP